jgi:hypothetical protein
MLFIIKFTGTYAHFPHATYEHGLSLVKVNEEWAKEAGLFDWLVTKVGGDLDVDADFPKDDSLQMLAALQKAAYDSSNPNVQILQVNRTINVFGANATALHQSFEL